MATKPQRSASPASRLAIAASILLTVIIVVSFVTDAISLGDLRLAEVDAGRFGRPSRGI